MEDYNKVVHSLAVILKKLPSEFREDYPKAVPRYFIDCISRFNNTYKTEIGNIKHKFIKMCEHNDKLQSQLEQKDTRIAELEQSLKTIYSYSIFMSRCYQKNFEEFADYCPEPPLLKMSDKE